MICGNLLAGTFVILVERHVIPITPEVVSLCEASARVYNQANYLRRGVYFENRGKVWRKPLPGLSEMYKEVADKGLHKTLHNTKTTKQTVIQCTIDWSNYFDAIKVWTKESGLERPQPPGYKGKYASVIFYSETLKRSDFRKGVIHPTNGLFSVKSKISHDRICRVMVHIHNNQAIVSVTYMEEEDKPTADNLQPKPDKPGLASIDLGINNLLTITSDQTSSVLVNGRPLKSMNQGYNQRQAKAKGTNQSARNKRYWRIENALHHISHWLIQWALIHRIGHIAIGRNVGWKQQTKVKGKMGRKTRQHFAYIPYDNLLKKITYKAGLVGITVTITEESYTSQASFIDRDYLPVYDPTKAGTYTFTGTRLKRGLYKTAKGCLINADVNGSLNIGRKVFGDTVMYSPGRFDRGLAVRPIRVTPY